MNLIKLTFTLVTLCFLALMILVVIAPIVVQDGANDAVGNGDTALGNISESVDNLNQGLETSDFGKWLNGLDN